MSSDMTENQYLDLQISPTGIYEYGVNIKRLYNHVCPGLLIYPDVGQQMPAQYEFEKPDPEQALYTFKLNVGYNGYETTKQRVDTDLRQVVTPFIAQNGIAKRSMSTADTKNS